MASRFYFQSSGSPGITPAFDAGWAQTGQATRLKMPRKSVLASSTALADSASITVPITTTQDILAYQFISDDIFLPVRLDASVLFSMVVRVLENATTNNVFLAYVLKAGRAADGLALSTLSSSLTNAGTEYAASAATRIFGSATTVALTATTVSEPWRLILEMGGHAQGPTAAGSYIHRVGCNAASDFALTSALTTDLNPWMELSVNLQATTLNNFKNVRGGDGISVSERIR